MELLRGGELLDKILKKESFCEREASVILEVLASTVNYLHDNGVSIWHFSNLTSTGLVIFSPLKVFILRRAIKILRKFQKFCCKPLIKYFTLRIF